MWLLTSSQAQVLFPFLSSLAETVFLFGVDPASPCEARIFPLSPALHSSLPPSPRCLQTASPKTCVWPCFFPAWSFSTGFPFYIIKLAQIFSLMSLFYSSWVYTWATLCYSQSLERVMASQASKTSIVLSCPRGSTLPSILVRPPICFCLACPSCVHSGSRLFTLIAALVYCILFAHFTLASLSRTWARPRGGLPPLSPTSSSVLGKCNL